jgi:hypothetical protein
MMNTMRMVTKIYTMNKALSNNKRAMSKRDSKWMGGVQTNWVLGWWVLERHYVGEYLKIMV